jgi:hypothetical protein
MRDHDSLELFLQRLTTQHDEYQKLQHKLNSVAQSRCTTILESQLAQLPSLIQNIGKMNRYQYRYTLELEVFADCVALHLACVNHVEFETVCRYPAICQVPDTFQQTRMILSQFLQDLYQRLLSSNFRYEVNQKQSRLNQIFASKCEYVDALFSRYARLVVVRVDLSYLTDVRVDIDQLESDLEYLNNRMKYAPLFNYKVGHLFKIEYGLDKGLHVHCLFFFDGAKHKGSTDWFLAKSIGECWCQIVGAYGQYWNCHDDKENYERLGLLCIGDIHYTDVPMINNLKQIVEYFCKRQQYIKPRDKPKMQLIRSGNLPDTDGVKRGAPRKGIVDDVNEKV